MRLNPIKIIVVFFLTLREYYRYYIIYGFDWDLSIGIRTTLSMATNKERIELSEAGLGSLQDGMNRMELGINDRLHHLEETLNKLTETIMASKGAAIQIAHHQSGSSRPNCEENEGGRQNFLFKMAKLEFPRYSGDDPTEWFNRVNQFF